LLAIRGNDRYLSQRLGCFDQTRQAVGQYAVIVGAEQSQRFQIPARWHHNTLITSHASRNSRK
jgi:hypothetical protein